MGALGRQIGKRIKKAVTPKADQVDLTSGQTRVKPATEAQRVTGNVAERARASGTGTGRIQGGAAVAGAAAAAAGGIEVIKMLLGSDSAASKDFKAAFAAARKDGEKTFTWRGKKYTTKTVEEVAGVKRERPPKPKSRPTRPTPRQITAMPRGMAASNKAQGGMAGKKPRNANIDYRKKGMFYVGGMSAKTTPINKGKK
tara:strand:+ start:429 stop:1025 length:597 start_codon:yes stop_codon:yes gene_type:complete